MTEPTWSLRLATGPLPLVPSIGALQRIELALGETIFTVVRTAAEEGFPLRQAGVIALILSQGADEKVTTESLDRDLRLRSHSPVPFMENGVKKMIAAVADAGIAGASIELLLPLSAYIAGKVAADGTAKPETDQEG